MIGTGYVRRMARYNRWQNESLYRAASLLSDEERRRERGAFFGSIHKTLNHLMWADRLWISRFCSAPPPEGRIPQSVSLYEDWETLRRERVAFDAQIVGWAEGLDEGWLAGDLVYLSYSAGREISGPRWQFVSHFFNHQTHHRGQVHCLLTQAGENPDDTDLPGMPE